MDKRLRRLALSWLTGKVSSRILRRSPGEGYMPSTALFTNIAVSFARRHSRRQAGASNLVLPLPKHRPAVQQHTRISICQFNQLPCSPKHDRTQKSLDPTVREAFVDVVLFFQVKRQREWSRRVMVQVGSQEQVATGNFCTIQRLTRSPKVTGGTLKRRPLRSHRSGTLSSLLDDNFHPMTLSSQNGFIQNQF